VISAIFVKNEFALLVQRSMADTFADGESVHFKWKKRIRYEMEEKKVVEKLTSKVVS
jgi:hypothetical protein